MSKVWDDEQKCYVSDSTAPPVFSKPIVSSGQPDSSWTKARLITYCESTGVEFNAGDTKSDLIDKINK